MNEIRNLSELYRVFEKGNNKRISYFRGQASDWPLVPSIARPTVTDDKTQSCVKFIVPKSAKHHLRRQLEVSGITTERLFPDYLETGTGNPLDLIGDCMRIRCEIFNASRDATTPCTGLRKLRP